MQWPLVVTALLSELHDRVKLLSGAAEASRPDDLLPLYVFMSGIRGAIPEEIVQLDAGLDDGLNRPL